MCVHRVHVSYIHIFQCTCICEASCVYLGRYMCTVVVPSTVVPLYNVLNAQLKKTHVEYDIILLGCIG